MLYYVLFYHNTSFNLAMAENNFGGVFNLFLGPKSSFCGSFYSDDLGELSLFVDFQSDLSRSYHHQKVRNIIFLNSDDPISTANK